MENAGCAPVVASTPLTFNKTEENSIIFAVLFRLVRRSCPSYAGLLVAGKLVG
jgi:hypothetical protein